MSIFSDIERLITEHGSANILRERLKLAEDQYTALENKNADLQSENDNLRLQLQKSHQQVEDLKKTLPSTPHSEFDETTHKILKIFFDYSNDISVDEVAGQIGIERSMGEYHFDLLKEEGFIIQTKAEYKGYSDFSPAMYSITAKGRKYVVKNNI